MTLVEHMRKFIKQAAQSTAPSSSSKSQQTTTASASSAQTAPYVPGPKPFVVRPLSPEELQQPQKKPLTKSPKIKFQLDDTGDRYLNLSALAHKINSSNPDEEFRTLKSFLIPSKEMAPGGGILKRRDANGTGYADKLDSFRTYLRAKNWHDTSIINAWNLINTTRSQRQRNTAETHTDDILPLYLSLAKNLYSGWKLRSRAENSASPQQAQILKQQIAENTAQGEAIGDYYNNLSSLGKLRYWTLAPLSTVPAAFGIFYGGKLLMNPWTWKTAAPWLLKKQILPMAVARGVRQAGEQITDAFLQDREAVARAIYSNSTNNLDAAQKQLYQKWREENPGLTDNQLAAKLQDSVENWKNGVGNTAQLLSWAAMPHAGGPLSRVAGLGVDYGLNFLTNGFKFLPKPAQSPERIVAEFPSTLQESYIGDSVEMRPEQKKDFLSRFMRIQNAGSFGLSPIYRIYKHLTDIHGETNPQPTIESLQQAVYQARQNEEQEGKKPSPSTVVNMAKVIEFGKQLVKSVSEIPKEAVDTANNELKQQVQLFKGKSQQQRQSFIRQLLSGKLGTKDAGALYLALQTKEGKETLASLANTAKEYSQLLDAMPQELFKKDAQPSVSTKIIKPALQDLFETDIITKFKNNVSSAQDPFVVVRDYMDLMKKIEAKTGEKLPQRPELKQYIKKILWDHIEKNPLNIHKMLALMAYEAGYNSLGDFLNSPGAFYGTLIGLPLTVMLMSSIFGGGNNNQSQQVPQQPNQWQFPAQYSIADRGLIAQ